MSSNPVYTESSAQETHKGFKINHPSLISALKAGKFRGRLYYIMEFADGTFVREELVNNDITNKKRSISSYKQHKLC